MIDDHSYDGNYINGIIDLTDSGIGFRQSFLLWALWARWIDYNIDEILIVSKSQIMVFPSAAGP